MTFPHALDTADVISLNPSILWTQAYTFLSLFPALSLCGLDRGSVNETGSPGPSWNRPPSRQMAAK